MGCGSSQRLPSPRTWGDETPHDERYARTTEYTRIILDLLEGKAPVTTEGDHYRVDGLRLMPPLPAELMPGVLLSGSSPAGLAAAEALGATAVKYPHPPGEEEPPDGTEFGVRVGIVARDTEDEAWRVADHPIRFMVYCRDDELRSQLAERGRWYTTSADCDLEYGMAPTGEGDHAGRADDAGIAPAPDGSRQPDAAHQPDEAGGAGAGG